MANKRMFTMKIVDSDAFLDMPLSTQCLYFHLNMRADDDGFVGNAKRIMKVIGASEDDLKILIAKRFLLVFEDGVIVIKHWRMHNTLSQNRYHETQYLDEKSMLRIKDNGSYSLESGKSIDDTKLIESAKRQSSRRTVDGQKTDSDIDLDLDLDLDKECIITDSKESVCRTEVQRAVDAWNSLGDIGIKSVSKMSSTSKRYKSLVARIKEYGSDKVIEAIESIRNSDFLRGKNRNGWTITFDWFILPNNFPKVLDGNYTNQEGQKQRTGDAKLDRLYNRVSEVDDWV